MQWVFDQLRRLLVVWLCILWRLLVLLRWLLVLRSWFRVRWMLHLRRLYLRQRLLVVR